MGTYTHTHTEARTEAHTHTQRHTLTEARTHTHTHTHTHTQRHTHTHTHTHRGTHTHTRTHSQTHTHTHAVLSFADRTPDFLDVGSADVLHPTLVGAHLPVKEHPLLLPLLPLLLGPATTHNGHSQNSSSPTAPPSTSPQIGLREMYSTTGQWICSQPSPGSTCNACGERPDQWRLSHACTYMHLCACTHTHTYKYSSSAKYSHTQARPCSLTTCGQLSSLSLYGHNILGVNCPVYGLPICSQLSSLWTHSICSQLSSLWTHSICSQLSNLWTLFVVNCPVYGHTLFVVNCPVYGDNLLWSIIQSMDTLYF